MSGRIKCSHSFSNKYQTFNTLIYSIFLFHANIGIWDIVSFTKLTNLHIESQSQPNT